MTNAPQPIIYISRCGKTFPKHLATLTILIGPSKLYGVEVLSALFSKEETTDNILRIVCYQLVAKGSGFKGSHEVLEPKALILYIFLFPKSRFMFNLHSILNKYCIIFQIETVV